MNILAFFDVQIKNYPWRAIALGVVWIMVTAVLVIWLGNIVDHVPLIAAFDRYVYEAIDLGPHPAWLTALVAPFNFNFLSWGGTFIPSFLYVVLVVGILYIIIFNRKNILFAIIAILLAVLLDAILFKLTNMYVLRDRPFVHLLNSLSDNSKLIWVQWPTYPSGHVRDMALYSAVLTGYAKKLLWPFIIITLWVSYSRIYLGAHYPTDVLAGLVLGYFVGMGILIIVKSMQTLLEKPNKLPLT